MNDMNLKDSILNSERLMLSDMLKHAIHHPIYIEYKKHFSLSSLIQPTL
jgi:hypothetical protein